MPTKPETPTRPSGSPARRGSRSSRPRTCWSTSSCRAEHSSGCSGSSRASSRPSTASASTCGAARCWASSASPAAARRRWAGRCWASCRRPTERSPTTRRPGHARSPRCAAPSCVALRTDLQMVFQDPSAALNPSMTIEEAVGHPLVVHKIAQGAELRRRVHDALERVGLAPVGRFATEVPLRPLGRPEAASGDRPRDHPRPGGPRGRRADLDARHERAGEDPAADARPQERAGADLPLHHPRPGEREVLLRPDRDHVPGPGRRGRADRGDLRQPAAPVHEGAAEGDPRARPRPGWCRATCRAARSRTPPSPRWAARSTRAAPRPSPSAAGSRATCASSSSSTGRAGPPTTTASAG